MTPQITRINTNKNLLAFSAGVDSTALFFILLENNIPFDMAIVNYNIREQSQEEIQYAEKLAKKYNKEIYIKNVQLENLSNFEKKARDIRYDFFEEIIEQFSYETLITAHQLNDKLEWFFMQLSKGAGLAELISFEEYKNNGSYNIFKPLVNTSKNVLLKYLDENNIKYFTDQSNFEGKYKRNYFRKNYANKFLDEFELGVKNSFDYLQKDLNSLSINQSPILEKKELTIFNSFEDNNLNLRIIDKNLKKRGILLSKLQRDEILKQKEIVISHKICINLTKKYIFISPFINTTMTKKFKEKCRVIKLPKNIRPYIFNENLFEDTYKIIKN
ncbi:tRNA lysidine(34) synthetase TilS [Arcobacter sp. LA11]|uniref:tRNA lysidine(34) synthetase TilS n=1 Tax=Arcobacter sp. LA11 TaxID=1898176 RepID=UPI00093389D7|nr:tRNA lysidine(34) synthetase TilS [Arcobacter sp. LA11]